MNKGHYQGRDPACLSKEIAPLLLNNDLKCLDFQLPNCLIKETDTPAIRRRWDATAAHFSANLLFPLTS